MIPDPVDVSKWRQLIATTAQIHRVDGYNWTVSRGNNLTDGNVFFFHMIDENTPDTYFISHYFNVTRNPVKTLSLILASTTSESKTLSPPATVAFPTAATSTGSPTISPNSTSADSDTGLRPEVKVRLGVGFGLGSALFIAVAVLVWYIRRRAAAVRDPNMAVGAQQPSNDSKTASAKSGTIPAPVYAQQTHPQELPGDYADELPAGNARYELE